MNVPVALTVRLKGNEFILKHHNKFPELLTTNGEVMLFDRNIYLPRKRQLTSYVPIHKRFLKNSEIRYEKSLKNLNMILENLKNITNDVVLDENTIKFKNEVIKPNFYFYKEKGNIYCNVKLNYFGYVVDLIKDKHNKSFLRDEMKEKLIDIELEKFKLIKKEKDYMFIGNDEDTFKLLSDGFLSLSKIGTIKASKELENLRLINSNDIFSELEEFDNFYKLKYNFDDFSIEELKEAIDSMKNGKIL